MPKREASRRAEILPPAVVEALRQRLKVQSEERKAAGPVWPQTGLVLTTQVGTVLSHSNVRRQSWLPLKTAARLPEWARPHALRHTVATVLLAQGRPLPEVAAVLGHASPAVTASTYAHVLREGSTAAAAAMARYYGDAGADAADRSEERD